MNNPSTFRIIMKRFLACFGCAAVLAASVSCTKDTTVTPEVKQGAIEITASVEGTRTSLEGADVRWSANDALGIFSGTKFVNAQFTTTDDNAASATFTGDATDAEGTEAAKAFAYYPYAAGATLEGTTVSGLEIPAEQTFAEGTFATTLNPMAAVGEDHTTLAFRSVGAVLRFKLTGTDTFNKLILTGNNDESIAGAYALDFSGEVPVMTFSGEGKSITVKCASDVTLKTDVATEVHFVVPAGIEFSKGISLKIVHSYYDWDAGDVDKEVLTRTFRTPLTTAANKLYNVTEFAVEDLSKGMDANLRTYLLNNYDANNDGLLSQAEADNVTAIRSAGFTGDVKSLQYIDRFTNLETLYINSNCQELYGTTLSNNKKLQTVVLSPANGLWSSLNVNGLPELQEFQLSFSNDQANLSKINLADNPKLKKVVIKGAKSLETLDLTNSASTVEMFWLQSCPKMTTVDIHEMPITTFASADYATSGMNMQPDGTLIIATVAQKNAMASRYSDYEVSVTWWCVDEERTEAAASMNAVLRKAILADETVNPVGDVNTVITAEMLAKVTEIRISTAMDATGLNLDGLELCPNLTTLSINAWQVSLGDIELSGFTKLTDVTMSPTAGYTSIKLPAGIKKFKSVISYTNHEPVGPTTLDLTQYTDLEYVNVMDSYSKPAVLTSLNVSGLSKLALLYVGGTPEVNIANCPLLTTCISNYGTYDSGFYWSGSSSSQTIIVESEAKRDQLKASWKKVMGYDEENPANAWTIQQ